MARSLRCPSCKDTVDCACDARTDAHASHATSCPYWRHDNHGLCAVYVAGYRKARREDEVA